MDEVLAWPVVSRDEIVRAFRPGSTAPREAQFRRLRSKRWASAGSGLAQRRDGRLAGRIVMYCALNMDAARLARAGHPAAARRAAETAERIEMGEAFAAVLALVSALDIEQQEAVVRGAVPAGALGAELENLVRTLAEQTALLRTASGLIAPDEWIAGRVSELRDDTVLVRDRAGARTAVPLWMARSVHRDRVGDWMVLVSTRLDEHQALVQAVPGINIPRPRASSEIAEVGYTPFGRGDGSTASVSGEDLDRLSGEPAPLRILVPVVIDE